MPTVPRKSYAQKITAWSFSRWNDYNSCPRKAMYKHVMKMKEPGSAAMDRGTAIHKLAEDYVKGTVPRLPAELKLFDAFMKKMKAKYKKERGTMIVEDNWAFDGAWGPSRWDDWANCVVRIKLDLAYSEGTTLHIVDYKTGKFSEYKNEEYKAQQELYALAGLLRFPTAETVLPQLAYLDQGFSYPRPANPTSGFEGDPEFVFTRKDEPRLIKVWGQRTKKMLADTTFKPTPGNACTYCHFRKNNGGPCQF